MKRSAIVFLPDPRPVSCLDEHSVLEVALKNKIDLTHSCGGMGSCTTCRVWVESDPLKLSTRTELEQEIADSRNFSPNERLACQLKPHDGLIVRIPPSRKPITE